MTYTVPTATLLDTPPAIDEAAEHADVTERTRALNDALAGFDVDARVVSHVRGAAATRYDVELGSGVRVEQIERLERSLASAVGVPEVRMTGTVRPGVIGIEVANKVRDVVPLRRLLDEIPDGAHPLDVPIGADIAGRPVVGNLGRMPHLLIAGTTGSGKSVEVNALLTTLLLRCSPDQLRLVLIDPKRVELAPFASVPHLNRPLVTEVSEAARALEEVVEEMELRYARFEEHGQRDIASFNMLMRGGGRARPMPYIVVVVDELADLMMTQGKRIEAAIVRIGQKARAAGIHLVLATQRPSADVVTGLIKANVPSRLVFSVASMVDSKVALDATGAQALAGQGDALYRPVGAAAPQRVQGPWVSPDEVERVVDAWAQQEVRVPDDIRELAPPQAPQPQASPPQAPQPPQAPLAPDAAERVGEAPVTMAEVVALVESMAGQIAGSLKETKAQTESITQAFTLMNETYRQLINDAIDRESRMREEIGELKARLHHIETAPAVDPGVVGRAITAATEERLARLKRGENR